MEQRKHFKYIEIFISQAPEMRALRFVNIKSSTDVNFIYYYDCLLSEIVRLDRKKIIAWKDNNLTDKDFPFSDKKDEFPADQPPFNKKIWQVAVSNALKISLFLEKTYNDILSTFKETEHVKLKTTLDMILHNIKITFKQNDKFTSHSTNKDFFSSLESPNLFYELEFKDRHKNNVYLQLEKIINNLKLLSKYQMTDSYISTKKIDEYLVNHIKNIHFSQSFLQINLEDETISILTKINNHLVKEIDDFLTDCINQQMNIMNNIGEKFKKNTIEK